MGQILFLFLGYLYQNFLFRFFLKHLRIEIGICFFFFLIQNFRGPINKLLFSLKIISSYNLTEILKKKS